MRDIEGLDDIRFVVYEFYIQVRQDALLSPVFALRIADWQPHLDTMYRFWNAALFGVREYVGNPFVKHAELPIDGPHVVARPREFPVATPLPMFVEPLPERGTEPTPYELAKVFDAVGGA